MFGVLFGDPSTSIVYIVQVFAKEFEKLFKPFLHMELMFKSAN